MNGKKSCLNCRWHDVFKWIICGLYDNIIIDNPEETAQKCDDYREENDDD